jgi:hypothetical protein
MYCFVTVLFYTCSVLTLFSPITVLFLHVLFVHVLFCHVLFCHCSLLSWNPGKGIFDHITTLLKLLKIDLADCRGQGYDNGANMKGIYKGVQAYILKENSKAFYTPCACHNLNLVLGDVAKSSQTAINFFNAMQKIYTLFAGSVHRCL